MRNAARGDGAIAGALAAAEEMHAAMQRGIRGRVDALADAASAGSAENESALVRSLFRLAQRCSMLGDQPTVRHVYELLLPFQDRVVTVAAGRQTGDCAAAYFVGLVAICLADWDAAVRHFHRALSINERIAATYEAAQTRYAYASVLVIRDAPGDWEHARHLLSTTVSMLPAADLAPVGWDVPVAAHAATGGGSGATRITVPAENNVFRPAGDYWTLAYEAKQFHIRGVRGLQYIARLLRHPHHDVHVLDLVGAGLDPFPSATKQTASENGLSVARLDNALPLFDPSARRAYVARLRDLRTELVEAANNNDLGRSAALEREIQFLADELLAASRPGGRCATTASPAERARISVRNAITGALKAITPHHRELAQHLGNAIRTGTTCCYAPDRPVEWVL